MMAVLEAVVFECHKKTFWDECKAGYARLKADPEAWAEYQEELRLWDCTSTDDLEDWPYECDE